jgi:hypothetical protein
LLLDATSLRTGTVSGFNGSTWHAVKLSVSGSTIAITLDGAPLVSLTDATRRGGMAAFASSYNANMFDDLIVEPVGVNGNIPTTALQKYPRISKVLRQNFREGKQGLFRSGSPEDSRLLKLDGKIVDPWSRTNELQVKDR